MYRIKSILILLSVLNLLLLQNTYGQPLIESVAKSEQGNHKMGVAKELNLTSDVGYITISEHGIQLFLSSVESTDEYRVPIIPGTPLELEVGEYNYRLTKPHYKEVTGTFEILPGVTKELQPEWQPTYATLRVHSNARNIRLITDENDAPFSTRYNILYLEQGERLVEVTSTGYESVNLKINAKSGEVIDTTLILLTLVEARDLREREQLPFGELTIEVDLDTDIFINGRLQGNRYVSKTIVSGNHQIELRHPIGNRQFSMFVPPAGSAERFVYMRPSKRAAITYAIIAPGAGHLYTKRSRGYAYLAGVLAAAGFTVWQISEQNKAQSDLDNAMELYIEANSAELAAKHRAEALSAFNNQQSAYDNMIIGISALVGIYAIQLIDIAITNPKYGYRDRDRTSSRVQAGFSPEGATLAIRF